MSLTSESFISERAQVLKKHVVVGMYDSANHKNFTTGLVGAILAGRGASPGDSHFLHPLTVPCHRHAG